jgi:DNA-binding MarR family transcriptional regulator
VSIVDILKIRDFRKTLRRFERQLESQIKDCCCCGGLTMAQSHVLLEIELQGETTTVALAQALGLDKSTLSRTVDGLVNIGLVGRRENPEDRRYTLLSLTEQGRKTCAEINLINDKYYGSAIDSIEEEKREQVIECFGVLVDAIAGRTD